MIRSQSCMGTQPNPVAQGGLRSVRIRRRSRATSRKYGTPIRLQGKPLQILSLLVNRSGQIISRDELQRHLWEGTTFVDFEQGLNSAVNKLRQTLGRFGGPAPVRGDAPRPGIQIHRSHSASFDQSCSGDGRPDAVEDRTEAWQAASTVAAICRRRGSGRGCRRRLLARQASDRAGRGCRKP